MSSDKNERFINRENTFVNMAKDEGLEELLIGTFQVKREKANQAAQTLELDQFYQNFVRLESMIGFEGGVEVVKEGDFLDYQNSKLEIYFQLAMTVHGKMDSSLPIPIKPFYSIKSLKSYLGIKEEEKMPIDSSKLNIASYRLLHKDNPASRRYLDSLIGTGEVNVDRNEFWNKSLRAKGGRGQDILRRIGYELPLIFNDLELGKPEFEINFGQNKLTVNKKTQEILGRVRDQAYSLQR